MLDNYPPEPYRGVRYGRNILPDTPLRFDTNSIPIPETSVSSGRIRYRYPGYRYTLDCNAGGTGIFSVRPQYATEHTGIVRYDLRREVLDTSVSSVRTQYRSRQVVTSGTTSTPIPDKSISSVRAPNVSCVTVYLQGQYRG